VSKVRTISTVMLLDLDPDLGARLEPDDQTAARRACPARLMRIPRGRVEPPDPSRDDLVGWVILQGALCREIGLRDRFLFELLGPGDVLQPSGDPEAPRLGGDVRLTATTEVAVLVLERPFIVAAARWPSLLAEVHGRLESQRQRLAIQALINHLPRAEHRLLLQLWHLAQRWGKVTPDGTLLDLPLTHDLLGHLGAARRSTTTLALSALETQGMLRRVDHGGWLVTHTGENRVELIARTSSRPSTLGDALKLRRQMDEGREQSRALRAEADQIRSNRGRRLQKLR
jgi:CRP-like cAMP-binding protein